MDTTAIQIVTKPLDDFINNHLTQIHEPSFWNTIIPLLIGSGLTLTTQLLIEFWKSSKTTSKQKQELISKGWAKTYLISQLLRELAMYKVHKKYYWRLSVLHDDPQAKEDAHKKHYEKGQEQRLAESKLSENIADYFQIVTEFIIITGNEDDFKTRFKEIMSFKHPKASSFDDCSNPNELVQKLNEDEDRLNAEYNQLRNLIDLIQSEMK